MACATRAVWALVYVKRLRGFVPARVLWYAASMHGRPGTGLDERLDAAAVLCAGNGAQLTALRRSVLALILQAEGPLTAYQLLDQLKAVRKSAVPPTVYRALEFLIENRLVHRIERLNAFVPCSEAHEHGADQAQHAVQFLICGKCGSVAEIEDDAVTAALKLAAEKQGFYPGNAIVEIDGVCALCRR
jgi:Fur family zinc uptake transcriptional regulator